jgi:uncharacterized membrane protein
MNNTGRNKEYVWKWGWCFWNPDDERVWVPKKDPATGFTLNFAHRQAYAFLFLILLGPALVIFLIWLLG